MKSLLEKASAITPIELRAGYYFKRDDLFQPFDFSQANGTKLRQLLCYASKHPDLLANGLVTGTSPLSPQGVMSATLAKYLGVPFHLFSGGSVGRPAELVTKDYLLKKYPYLRLIDSLGGTFHIASKSGFTHTLEHHASGYAKDHDCLLVKHGINLKDNVDCFLESVALQVQNIPDDLREIVVTIGSGMTVVGILYGIALYGKKVDRVYGVGCAPNRVKFIASCASLIYEKTGVRLPLHLLTYVKGHEGSHVYQYDNTIDYAYAGLLFHPRYEAKAWHWMSQVLRPAKDGRTLFWVTGHQYKF